MKKSIFRVAMVAAMTAVPLTACDKSQKADEQPSESKPAVPAELKIACV